MAPLSYHARFLNIGLYTAVITGLADQLSKGYVLSLLQTPPYSFKINAYLNLVRVWNKGVTFGFASSNDYRSSFLLAGIALLVVLLLLRWLMRSTRLMPSIALGLVIGGAVGNIIDRLRFGAVFDFIDFHIANWHWYAFNVADSAIVVGVAMLLLDNFIVRKE